MGRKREFEERITLPLSAEMLERLDHAVMDGETRLTVIREAIDSELQKRSRKAKRQGTETEKPD